jgi:hypothetical protein
MMWLLAICTGILLLGCSVMIILCAAQIFNEMVIEPIRTWKHRLPADKSPDAA